MLGLKHSVQSSSIHTRDQFLLVVEVALQANSVGVTMISTKRRSDTHKVKALVVDSTSGSMCFM